jgi:hypothetical protein
MDLDQPSLRPSKITDTNIKKLYYIFIERARKRNGGVGGIP